MKITIRLWLLISAAAVFVLALIWLFLIVLLPEMYSNRAYRELDSHADYILQAWEQSGAEDSLELLDKFVTENALHMDIITEGGEIFHTAGWELGLNVLTETDVERVLSGHYITKPYLRPGIGMTLVMAKLVYTPQRESMVLLVCAPMAPVEETQDLLRSYMLVISLISLGAALLLGYLSSSMFVKPIQAAERAAERIASGDYTERVNSKDGSELGDLARALDHMADQLGRLEVMRQDFIATVSHQFKTPLSIIQGHTEWIQDSLPKTEEEALRESFDVIADEVSRLDRMSRNILKLSELQSAAGPPNLTELPLGPFCHDILRSLEILAPNIVFAPHIPADLHVLADAANLEHVFRNILQNAIVHAGASRIDVTAIREEPSGPRESGRARVIIRDNGKGLTSEQAAHIWERFYKGNQKDRSGSGLGMSIAAAVIERHGGIYGVNSRPGKGTAVWFTLPVTDS